MAQKQTKAATKQEPAHVQALPGDFSPPYLRGMRHALRAVRTYLRDMQYADIRAVGDALNLPFIAALLLIEGHEAPVALEDFDQFNAWLETQDLTREQTLGEEA